MPKALLLLILIAALTLQAQQPLAKRSMVIAFQLYAGDQPLQAGTCYTTPQGDSIYIERFRFYVSNPGFNNNTTRPTNGYYLVDMADSASQYITIPVNTAAPTQFGFLLGVDSLRNVSGVQTGALDPLNGMFWTWNSGYIMAKLEGISPQSPAAGQRFTYHIGGFRSTQNTAQPISLNIPANHRGDTLWIRADALRWFGPGFPLRIGEHPVCHSPGTLAVSIAGNYRHMFFVVQP